MGENGDGWVGGWELIIAMLNSLFVSVIHFSNND